MLRHAMHRQLEGRHVNVTRIEPRLINQISMRLRGIIETTRRESEEGSTLLEPHAILVLSVEGNKVSISPPEEERDRAV